jgi:CRP-like cAMP-binding protein
VSNIGYKVLQVAANAVIFEEDTLGDNAYLLKRGSVQLSKYIDGSARVLAVLKAPVMFGEMSLVVSNQKRSATVKALENCELVSINRAAFEALLKESPQMMKTTVELLVQRLKTCSAKVVHVPDLHQSVIHSLFMLQQHQIKSIDYILFLQETALILMQPQARIEAVINRLTAAGLLEKRKGQFTSTELCFLETQDFLAMATSAMAKKEA